MAEKKFSLTKSIAEPNSLGEIGLKAGGAAIGALAGYGVAKFLDWREENKEKKKAEAKKKAKKKKNVSKMTDEAVIEELEEIINTEEFKRFQQLSERAKKIQQEVEG